MTQGRRKGPKPNLNQLNLTQHSKQKNHAQLVKFSSCAPGMEGIDDGKMQNSLV